MSNHMHFNMWNKITYPFPNFNGATVEILEQDELFSTIFYWEWLLIHAEIKVTPCVKNESQAILFMDN